MAGLRWVGCGVVLVLSCGRTASKHELAASAGSPPTGGASAGSSSAAGGTTSGGAAATGSSGFVSGEAGESDDADCLLTPVAGTWVAIDPDPYGFELVSDGSHLSGKGCLGGLSGNGALFCSPLVFQRERGRNVAFVWDMTQAPDADGLAYWVKMKLTLSPERTEMAGKVWTSLGSLEGEGQDVVLVRYPEQAVPAETECSGGEPDGSCFLAPLRSDQVHEPRVVELAGGGLLLLWLNRRAVGERIACTRLDASFPPGKWQFEPEFLDDGSGPVDASLLVASPQGNAVVAYRQNGRILARAFFPDVNAWFPQKVVIGEGSLGNARPVRLLVNDGGDATLIVAFDAPGGATGLAAVDFVFDEQAWKAPRTLVMSGKIAGPQWAAASDSARNELVTWAVGDFGEPFELWFSSRSAGGSWSEPAKLYTGDKQIISPAVAIGKDGNAIVTWQEWVTRLASSSYSFKTGVWSEPLTITLEPSVENGAVTFNEAGTALAYFHRKSASDDSAEQRTQLLNGAWSAPEAIPIAEADGNEYSVAAGTDGLVVTPLHPRAGQLVPPAVTRPWCEGY